MKKTGILLINLGTPDHCDRKSVYRYLTEFLNDPRVIDLPAIFRWILVNVLIVPFRSGKAAKAYKQIWTEAGSPLLVHSKALQIALQHKLGAQYQVALGMRYGNPSIESALATLENCHTIHVIPLFPQYSSAATGSAIEKTLNLISKQWNIPALHVWRDFYDHPAFVLASADLIKQTMSKHAVDVVLFSYHGLPERHISKSACLAACDHEQACPAIEFKNQYCYRAQCYATTRAIAAAVGLTEQQYRVAFQSRLGRTPWIKPYTDLMLPELIQQGVKNIAVVCPSFVADCLETLEEVNIRLREQWRLLGGESFHYVPCPNDHPVWVDGLAGILSSRKSA